MRATIRRFIWLSAPIIILFTLGIYIAHKHDLRQMENRIAYEARGLELQIRRLTAMAFGPVESDIRILRNSPSVARYISNPNPQTRAAVEEAFTTLLNAKSKYDQVRLIDDDGMERARIDRRDNNLVPVADAELQDKSDRYYFSEALKGPLGSIHVSI